MLKAVKKLTKKILAFVLPTVFILLSLSSQRVFATTCFPLFADSWFKTQLSFDQNAIPNGIEIVKTGPTSSSYRLSDDESYVLVNKGSEPFFIVSENPDNRIFPNSELPKNYKPWHKIQSNQVYFWNRWDNVEGWYPWPRSSDQAANIEIDWLLHNTEVGSKQISEYTRPPKVEIPGPDNFKILGFYKGAPVKIRGSLHYYLNENFTPVDPARIAAYKECQKHLIGYDSYSLSPQARTIGMIISVLIIIAITISIIVILLGVIKWIRSKGDKAKIKSAHHIIIKGILGLILTFLAYFIITVFASLFGI